MSGKETVMLFLIQPYCSLSVPEMKQLKKFLKISLEPGQTQTVNFTLSTDDWSVYYPQICHGLKKVAEDYAYVVGIKPETDCDEPAFTLSTRSTPSTSRGKASTDGQP